MRALRPQLSIFLTLITQDFPHLEIALKNMLIASVQTAHFPANWT